VQSARDNFFAETLKDVPLSDIVVLDESYVTTKFTRLRGRSLRGERLRAGVPHGNWKVLTVLAAISVTGVVAAASIYAATDTDVFVTFVREALVPALRPGQVVVMDNLASHHVALVRELVEGATCRLVFLPPYSPDLSPIEPAWSKVKQCVRSRDPRDAGSLAGALEEGFAQLTPGDCLGFFRGCGYTLHLK
jgi:transposase